MSCVQALLRELRTQMESSAPMTITHEMEPMAATISKPNNRCGSCRKKLMLTDLTCRCKARFCSAHRAPEEHACTHDFRADANSILKKQLERVVADKVERL